MSCFKIKDFQQSASLSEPYFRANIIIFISLHEKSQNYIRKVSTLNKVDAIRKTSNFHFYFYHVKMPPDILK